jgi:hypothetical protein
VVSVVLTIATSALILKLMHREPKNDA